MFAGIVISVIAAVTATPVERRAIVPTVQTKYATVVGYSAAGIDSFKGIPFAQPPVGQLRLKPPQAITSNQGTVLATALPNSCPQFYIQANTTSLPQNVIAMLNGNPFFQQSTAASEDCLTLNVQRPSTATSSSKLPVVFWIYGGGFEFGSTQIYDATQFVSNSVAQGKPVIFVAVNYRLGGFGFLGGKEILADKSANLGLLDQRLALKWVADNIAAFGGDPSKVTIWGESAGSISVLDQMILNNGDNKYNGKPLFRGAIMDSGSIVPADPVDCPKAQQVYNQVVANAGCAGAANTLTCLRSVSYETFLNAANSVPSIFSYNSVALSYLPRPDGTALVQSPELAVAGGKIAQVPFIVGDQEDEGTLFSLTQANISTTAQLQTYLQTIFFNNAPAGTIAGLLKVYPDDPSAGSPYDTGLLYNIYPQYKRIASILGDLTFTLTRRAFLNLAATTVPSVPSWSYLASYYDVVPILGTFHATDVLSAFGYVPGVPQQSIQSYYYSFINTLDPNDGTSALLPKWPRWSTSKQLLNFQALTNALIPDTFRTTQYNFLAANTASFRI